MAQDDVRKILAQNIKKRRKELGITQSKLAEFADISEPYMNDIERCQTWVSDKTLSKLAWALNIDIHELFIQDRENSEKTEDREKTTALFQKHKNEMIKYVENSFETLMRGIIKT